MHVEVVSPDFEPVVLLRPLTPFLQQEIDVYNKCKQISVTPSNAVERAAGSKGDIDTLVSGTFPAAYV